MSVLIMSAKIYSIASLVAFDKLTFYSYVYITHYMSVLIMSAKINSSKPCCPRQIDILAIRLHITLYMSMSAKINSIASIDNFL